MLTYREAEKMVMPYIDGQLSDEELEQFLKHIDTCPDCWEELEIYYTVSIGLKQLDDESDDYDITGALQDSLDYFWLRVRGVKLRRVICYAADTLGALGLLVTLLLQFRLWVQTGVF